MFLFCEELFPKRKKGEGMVFLISRQVFLNVQMRELLLQSKEDPGYVAVQLTHAAVKCVILLVYIQVKDMLMSFVNGIYHSLCTTSGKRPATTGGEGESACAGGVPEGVGHRAPRAGGVHCLTCVLQWLIHLQHTSQLLCFTPPAQKVF